MYKKTSGTGLCTPRRVLVCALRTYPSTLLHAQISFTMSKEVKKIVIQKKVERRAGFKKSPSLLRRVVTKHFINHPLYFQCKNEEQNKKRLEKKEKGLEEKDGEQKRKEHEEKKEKEVKQEDLEMIFEEVKVVDAVTPIDEKIVKFRCLSKGFKYLLIAVEDGGFLLQGRCGDVIRTTLPHCSAPPPSIEIGQKLYLVRGDILQWVTE